MLFNSLSFLLYFPVVTVLYILLPRMLRLPWLLAASYFFYMCWNPRYAALIALSTVLTWLSGLALGRLAKTDTSRRKLVVGLCCAANLGILAFFKYGTFILENIAAAAGALGFSFTPPALNVLLPVGISFYTFQALSYTVDVYRGDIEPEKNLMRYALFVSFFPQLVAGPIERSGSLLRQIQKAPAMTRRQLLDYERIAGGLTLMAWGFFLKMVIADRVSILVDTVFGSYFGYHSFALLLGALGFSLQIYCDFSSYSTIAIGAAQVLGFTLMENFDTPYLARSVPEFWRRWHISLSTWFRDYLYIPLGGNRCSKLRHYANILITFLVSGLWHGANWTYVIWGGLHGVYQIIGKELRPVKDRLNARLGVKTGSFSHKLGQTLVTFGLSSFAFIFFRADTVGVALGYIARMLTKWDPWALSDGTLYTLGLDRSEWNVLFIALLVLLVVDLLKYRTGKRIDVFLREQSLWFRWLCVGGLVLAVVIFGEYGLGFDAKQFIYFQF